MAIEPGWLFAIALVYLGSLFIIAWVTDSGWLSDSIVKHPLTYSLSLGVYATSWTYYGSVGLADRSGYAFLTIYLGLTGAFILGPYLLKPLLRLSRDYQLTSIADLLAFRYGGRATGLIVTIFMLIGILPYISLQIKAVTESMQILSRQAMPDLAALMFCLVITVFAILFGARHLTPREKHDGLVVAIAFESAIKLIALVLAGIFVVTQVFESPRAMTQWADQQPDMLSDLAASGASGMWTTLLLLAFCAAFTLPRQYHMTFTENQSPSQLSAAYWQFPLYLLVLNLPIIPILFAGRYLSLPVNPDFYVLGIALTEQQHWLAILVFIGGVSAASAMMIVTTLALSSMCMNNLLLPATLAGRQDTDLYRRMLFQRRAIIASIIAAGYGFYVVIELNEGLASLGLISFVAAAQLLPGIIGLLFWPRGTQLGFIGGLLSGALVWFVLLILPLINARVQPLQWVSQDIDIWTLSSFCTLACNAGVFIVLSLLSTPSPREQAAAQAAIDNSGLSSDGATVARSVVHYRYALQQALGNKVAEQELERALSEARIAPDESRSSELRLLHEHLERNLTGLVGPSMAQKILHRQSANDPTLNQTTDVRLLERRLQTSREQMRGLTKQLDDLRQYLQTVLRQIPLGVCSVSSSGRITIWNSAMRQVTGIEERDAYGKSLAQLDPPWGEVLNAFANSDEDMLFRESITIDSSPNERHASVNLHKARIEIADPEHYSMAGAVLLVEDRTHLDTLESELAHSERLASIGRLAAGVAHEIGNPLTGIASIAQNLQHDLDDIDGDKRAISTAVQAQTGDILTQVGRINTIVRSLLSFSHADPDSEHLAEPVDVVHCVYEALRLVRLSPDTRHLSFHQTLPDTAMVRGDGNSLIQVFVNLINNACDASPLNGSITINAQRSDKEVIIDIIDQGHGIASQHRDQIFEPFFTTKPVGEGTGLGLSLAYSIVNKHKGQLRLADSSAGTRMTVSLPECCQA